jgi:WD40 repeat protein
MNKLAMIITFGIVLLCMGTKFNSMAMSSVNLTADEIASLQEQIKKLDAEIVKKEHDLEKAGQIEEFGAAKELNRLRKQRIAIENKLTLNDILAEYPIRKSIPAQECPFPERIKRIIDKLKPEIVTLQTPLAPLYIDSIAWSHDENKLATSSPDFVPSPSGRIAYGSIVQIWNTHGTRLGQDLYIKNYHGFDLLTNSYIESSWSTHPGYLWSPDDAKLAFLSTTTTVKIQDIARNIPYQLDNATDVISMAWSPDGAKLAIAYESYTKIWDIPTGKQITLNQDMLPTTFLSVAWSPDGTKLATGSELSGFKRTIGEIKIWDATTGIAMRNLLHGESIYSMGWSPDGSKIAAEAVQHTGGNVVLIWNQLTGEVRQLQKNNSYIQSIGWNSNGSKLAVVYRSGSGSLVAQIWDAATGIRLSPELVAGDFLQISWSPDGTMLLSTRNNIKIWDANTGAELWQDLLSTENTAAWSPDGTNLATASNVEVKIWDIATKKPIASIVKVNPNPHGLLAWSPNSKKLAIGSYNTRVVIWDWKRENLSGLNHFITHLNIDQCDLLQAFDMAIKEKGRIDATEDQWHTFTTFPKPLRDALRIYIKEPIRANPPALEENKRKEMEERVGKAFEQM